MVNSYQGHLETFIWYSTSYFSSSTLHTITKIYRHVNFIMCMSAYVNFSPTGRIFIKYDIGDFHIWLKLDNSVGHFI
jgi:hypothetical protein